MLTRAHRFIPFVLVPAALATAAASFSPSHAIAQEPAGEEVTLAFKYKTGQQQRFRGEVKSDFSVTPEGEGGGIGPIPISAKMNFTALEKVAGTRQGTGTLSVSVPLLNLTTNVFGTEIAITSSGGKVTTLVNGQPAQAGAAMPGMDPSMLKSMSAPTTLKRDARGATIGDLGGLSVFAGATMGILELPDKPVKKGDSWETVRKQKLALPGPLAAAAGGVPEMEMKFTHTLKNLETKAGKLFAIIESSGAVQAGGVPGAAGAPGANPATGAAGFQQDMTGTTRFDVARGSVVGGRFTVTFGSKVNVPTPMNGGAAAPVGGGMRIDGNVETTLNEITTATTPAKKKPATRKRK